MARRARANRVMWAVAQKHAEVVRLLSRVRDVPRRTEAGPEWGAAPRSPQYNRIIQHGPNTALMFAARVGDLASGTVLVEVAPRERHDAGAVSATTLAAFSDWRVGAIPARQGADLRTTTRRDYRTAWRIMRRDSTPLRRCLRAERIRTRRSARGRRARSSDDLTSPELGDARPTGLRAIHAADLMRLLAKHGADPKVIRANYVGRGYKRRKERTTASWRAGMGGTHGCRSFDRAERDARSRREVAVLDWART